jgi:hypothetical protein
MFCNMSNIVSLDVAIADLNFLVSGLMTSTRLLVVKEEYVWDCERTIENWGCNWHHGVLRCVV